LPLKIGFEVIREVGAEQVPFMVLSSLSQESDMDKAKKLGAVEYFVKNQVIIEDLIDKVAGFLKKPN